MSGKSTFKGGVHPSRAAAWEVPVVLSQDHINDLSEIFGRGITADEIERLQDLLEMTRGMRDTEYSVSNQDTKRTLTEIAKCGDADIYRALKDCDERTRAIMTDALRQMREPDSWNFDQFSAAKLKAAALFAQASLTTSNGGAPVKGYREIFARAFAGIWLEMTSTEIKHWESGGDASADVKAAQLLLSAIGDHLSLSPVAKLLRKVIA